MTDTGRVPGKGQPGHADAQPEAPQPPPTAAAHGAYAYVDPEADQCGSTGDDEDLLMPGARSAWSDGQSASGQYAAQRAPQPAQARQPVGAPSGGQRRPLHLGPPVPEQSGAVRTLADRGPRAPAPTPPRNTAQPRPAAQAQTAVPVPAPQDGPATGTAPGSEYLDVPHQGPDGLTGPQLGEAPARQEDWDTVSAPPAGGAVDQAAASPQPGPDLAEGPSASAGPAPDAPRPAAGSAAGQGVSVPHPAALVGGPQPELPPRQQSAVPHGPDAVREPEQPQDPATAGGASAGQSVADPRAVVAPVPAPVAEQSDAPATPGEAPQDAAATTDSAVRESSPTPPGKSDEPAAHIHSFPTAATAEPAGDPVAPEPRPQRGSGSAQGQTAPVQTAPNKVETPPADPVTDEDVQPAASEPEPGDADGTPLPAPAEGGSQATQEETTAGVPRPRAAEPGTTDTASAASGETAVSPEATATAEQESTHRQTADQPGQPDASAAPSAPPGLAQDTVAPRLVAAAPDGAPHAVPTESEAPGVVQTDKAADTAVQESAVPEQTVPPISGDGPQNDAAPSGDGTATEEPAVPCPAPAPTAPAPGYAEAEREAVHRLMRERRDIRNGFRSDPIPHEVLLRVLEAAHTAPSVGHSQPWDFVVIRSEETRRTMHELAQEQRDAYAKSLPKARAKQFKELKIEAILDTPVNIVVTADPTRGGRHTLGRHTQPQMAPYSSALAVENLWLAARAEGLGVGWVSFFDEREMVRTLDLPDHLEVVAYLCIGYVDEFPAEPELTQAGWSKRRPLSWVVHEESYGRRALPGAEPHDLLAETLERIRPLDAKALGEAWERQKRMTKPAGALGMLEIISAQLCGLSRQCPPPIPEPAAVAVFAGDHGVHAQGVTPWPQEVTAQMVANFLGGGAVCNAFANQVGAEVCIVDVGVSAELPATPGLLPRKVRAGTADMTQGPALTQEEVLRAFEVGIETARDLVAAGNKALVTGEMGIANTTVSAALIAACTGADPAEVTGRGTGIDDETHARKVNVVRAALQLHRPDPADPVGTLAAIGGLEHAALTGLILGGASLRTPVILDGVSAGAAALVARQIAPEALAACIAGHRSAEPGHVAALTKLGLRPLIDLDLRLGEGTGALLALPMVQSAARAMHEVATFDSAGVTEKN